MPSNRPVDLSEILREAKIPTDLPPSMARGVDLNMIRDKRKHQHRFCAIGRFRLSEEQTNAIQEQLDAAKALADVQTKAGVTPTPVPINVPLESEKLAEIQGPGCTKCGVHMTDPEKGFGKLCEKSDDEFPGIVEQYAADEARMAPGVAAEGGQVIEFAREEGDTGDAPLA